MLFQLKDFHPYKSFNLHLDAFSVHFYEGATRGKSQQPPTQAAKAGIARQSSRKVGLSPNQNIHKTRDTRLRSIHIINIHIDTRHTLNATCTG